MGGGGNVTNINAISISTVQHVTFYGPAEQSQAATWLLGINSLVVRQRAATTEPSLSTAALDFVLASLVSSHSSVATAGTSTTTLQRPA